MDVVDHEDFNGAFGGFEAQAELFLQGSKEGGKCDLFAIEAHWRGVVRLPAEIDVEASGQIGFVDDDAACVSGEILSEERHGDPLCAIAIVPVVDGEAVGFGRRQLWAGFRNDEFIDRKFALLAVGFEAEAVGEEGLNHREFDGLRLIGGKIVQALVERVVDGLGVDVEGLG